MFFKFWKKKHFFSTFFDKISYKKTVHPTPPPKESPFRSPVKESPKVLKKKFFSFTKKAETFFFFAISVLKIFLVREMVREISRVRGSPVKESPKVFRTAKKATPQGGAWGVSKRFPKLSFLLLKEKTFFFLQISQVL